jgi:hypothetical protein
VNPFPRLRKITDEADRQKVYDALRAEKENPHHLSHWWERDGQVVGAASIGTVPLLLLWHSPKAISPRDSLHIQRVYEAVFAERGSNFFWIACNADSPYFKHMAEFGCKPIWDTHIFEGGNNPTNKLIDEPVLPANGTPRMR